MTEKIVTLNLRWLLIHVVEHDIVATSDILHEHETGKWSDVFDV